MVLEKVKARIFVKCKHLRFNKKLSNGFNSYCEIR